MGPLKFPTPAPSTQLLSPRPPLLEEFTTALLGIYRALPRCQGCRKSGFEVDEV